MMPALVDATQRGDLWTAVPPLAAVVFAVIVIGLLVGIYRRSGGR